MTGLELKKYRETKGLTQEELGKLLFVSKRTIINYEKSEILPPAKVKLLHSIFNTDNLKEPEAQYVTFQEMNVMYVPLVTQYAQAGYLSGYGDEEYIDELPKIPFANDVQNKGDYLCFEVKGDSMDDGSYESYLEGDILLCRDIRQELWLNKLHLHRWKDFVIVHKEEGVLVKRIIDHDVENGIITLHSLNTYYEDFKVHLKDVAKLFNVVDFRRKISRRR